MPAYSASCWTPVELNGIVCLYLEEIIFKIVYLSISISTVSVARIRMISVVCLWMVHDSKHINIFGLTTVYKHLILFSPKKLSLRLPDFKWIKDVLKNYLELDSEGFLGRQGRLSIFALFNKSQRHLESLFPVVISWTHKLQPLVTEFEATLCIVCGRYPLYLSCLKIKRESKVKLFDHIELV